MKIKILISTFGLIISSIIFPVAVNAAEYNAYSADCDLGSTSTFTANKRGYYTWVWRTGSTVNGYGYQYLSAGQTLTPNTPAGTDNTSRFGVLTTSKTFAYVTCS